MDLRDLQGDVTPPSRLKARVEESLRNRGVLQSARRPSRLTFAAGVGGLALIGAAFMIGRLSGGRGGDAVGPPRYALLLYEDSTFTTSVPEQALVAEYSAWASDLGRRGIVVSGEKLGPAAARLGAWGRDVREGLSGFFIISAASDSAAAAIANSCPHLRHGGRIVVRRIDPT